MSRKKKDTDYVAISARLHVLENRMLTRERMEQMLEAREDAEATRIMADCGYVEPQPLTMANLEKSLAHAEAQLFAELAEPLADDQPVLDVFRVEHDYHNLKAILKSRAKGADPQRLLVPGGRYDGQRLLEDVAAAPEEGEAPEGYSPVFWRAMTEARALLAQTGDPQRSDFLLDRACYEELTQAAKDARSEFLQGYVRLRVDSVNLRSAVRAYRAGGDEALLEQALIPGGDVAPQTLLAQKPGELADLYKDAPLRQAALLGAELLEPGKGDMTAFERACDDAVTAYVAKARRVPFGVETVIGYLYARLAELTALRIILSGRLANMDKDRIRERLREAYV